MKNIFLFVIIIFFQVTLSGSKIEYNSSLNSDAGTMNYLVSALSDQLTQNKNFTDIEKSAIAITSFVSLDNLKSTSRLSNILSENLIHEMQIRGYKVIDFKTMNEIKIDARGDFLFSRDVSKLRKSLNVDYALTGTYIEYRKGTVVNARIINLKTHVVLSSAQIMIPRRVAKHISQAYKIPNFAPNKITLSKCGK